MKAEDGSEAIGHRMSLALFTTQPRRSLLDCSFFLTSHRLLRTRTPPSFRETENRNVIISEHYGKHLTARMKSDELVKLPVGARQLSPHDGYRRDHRLFAGGVGKLLYLGVLQGSQNIDNSLF